MCTYVCQIFVLWPIFLFVRALFGKTPSTRAYEARPDTSVEVSARSVQTYIFEYCILVPTLKVFPKKTWMQS